MPRAINLNSCRNFYHMYPLTLQESFYGVTVNGVNVPAGIRYSPHDRVDAFLYSGYQYDLNGGRTDSFSRRQVKLHMIMLVSYYKVFYCYYLERDWITIFLLYTEIDIHLVVGRHTRSIITKHNARRRYGSPGKKQKLDYNLHYLIQENIAFIFFYFLMVLKLKLASDNHYTSWFWI